MIALLEVVCTDKTVSKAYLKNFWQLSFVSHKKQNHPIQTQVDCTDGQMRHEEYWLFTNISTKYSKQFTVNKNHGKIHKFAW